MDAEQEQMGRSDPTLTDRASVLDQSESIGWAVPGVTPGAAASPCSEESAERSSPEIDADPGGEPEAWPPMDSADVASARLTAAVAAVQAGADSHDLVGSVHASLAATQASVAGLERAWAVDDALVTECLLAVEVASRKLDAVRSGLIRAHLSRAPQARTAPGRRAPTKQLLEDVCHHAPARVKGMIADAELTDPDNGILSRLGAALAAGEVTGEHVAVARRCLQDLPARVVREHADALDELLTGHARRYHPQATASLAAYLLAVLGVDRDERDPYAARRFALRHSDGSTLLAGDIDEVTGRTLDALLQSLIDSGGIHGVADDGTDGDHQGDGVGDLGDAGRQAEIRIPDTRTRAQKLADAFSEVVALAADHHGLVRAPDVGTSTDASSGDGRGATINRKPSRAVVRLVLHLHDETRPTGSRQSRTNDARPEGLSAVPYRDARGHGDFSQQCDRGHGSGAVHAHQWAGFDASTETLDPLAAWLVELASCDAVLDLARFDSRGRPVSFETVGRLATPGQAAAVTARDRCCSFPGCTRPPAMTQLHHVVWHRHGGPTSVDNLALLCGPHHRLIHAHPPDHPDAWQMAMINGRPHVRPPQRLTPAHLSHPPWIRNTYPDDLTETHSTAGQLSLL